MTGPGVCQARGEDPELRLQCIRPPHPDDPWHEDGPQRYWKNEPDDEDGTQ